MAATQAEHQMDLHTMEDATVKEKALLQTRVALAEAALKEKNTEISSLAAQLRDAYAIVQFAL